MSFQTNDCNCSLPEICCRRCPIVLEVSVSNCSKYGHVPKHTSAGYVCKRCGAILETYSDSSTIAPKRENRRTYRIRVQ